MPKITQQPRLLSRSSLILSIWLMANQLIIGCLMPKFDLFDLDMQEMLGTERGIKTNS